MKAAGVVALLLFSLPLACTAEDRHILTMQDELAQLQNQVNALQNTVDTKISALTELTQQALDDVDRVNTQVAVLENRITDELQQARNTLAKPEASANAEINQVSSQLEDINAAVAGLNNQVGTLQQQIIDLTSAVRTEQAPTTAVSSYSGEPPAGMSAETLYNNASQDESRGNRTLALKEFGDYLKYYGATDLASEAQFEIGQIYYDKGDLPHALESFNQVVQKYPASDRAADALYMEGLALAKTGKQANATITFREFLDRFPNSRLAGDVKAQLRRLDTADSRSSN